MAVTADRELQPEQRPGVVATIERWVFTTPLWILAGAVIAVSCLWFGLAFTPNEISWRAVSVGPFDQQWSGPSSYVYNSPIGPSLTWLLTDSGREGFRVVHIAVMLTSIVGTAYLVRRWVGDVMGRLFLLAWFCSPLANITVTWIGQPDPVTIAGATFVAVGPPWACLVGGALLGFNHFEQGVFIVIAAVVLRVVIRREPRELWAAIAGGLILGRALLWVLQRANGMNTGGARVEWLTEHGGVEFVRAWGLNAPTFFFSIYAVLWIPIIAWARTLPPRERWVLAATHAVLFAAVFITMDVTRVAALITWPVVMCCAMWAATRPNVRREAVILCGLALVIPRAIVWGGGVYVASW